MRTLLAFELKKLLNRRALWLALALGLALLVWFDMAVIHDGSGGYARGWRDTYARYEGQVMTEALRQRMEEDFGGYVAAHTDGFQETWRDGQSGDVGDSANGSGYSQGISDAYNWLDQTWTLEYRQELYDHAKQKLDTGVNADGSPLSYRAIRDNEGIVRNGVPTPVIRGALLWLEYFYQARGISTGILMLAVAVLALLGLYNNEASARMEAVVLTARYRRRLGAAKLLAGGIVVAAVTVFCLAAHGGLYVWAYGLTGIDVPAHLVFPAMDTTTLTAGMVGLLILAAKALAVAACASAVAWASARFRSPLLSLLAAAGVWAVTMLGLAVMAVPGYDNSPVLYAIGRYAVLLPLTITLGDVLYEVAHPSQLTCLLVFPVAFTALLCILAQRAFLRRRRV